MSSSVLVETATRTPTSRSPAIVRAALLLAGGCRQAGVEAKLPAETLMTIRTAQPIDYR